MLKKTALRTGTAAGILLLSACSWFQQPAAPVYSGTDSTGYGAGYGSVGDNPYGAAPYSPNAGGNTAYSGGGAPAYTGGTGTYVPSYAPVNIHAATHTVVRGDTVFNIAKRYQITQDNLRAWNNLVDNNIHVGQVLRVKPAGYVPPRGASSSSGSSYASGDTAAGAAAVLTGGAAAAGGIAAAAGNSVSSAQQSAQQTLSQAQQQAQQTVGQAQQALGGKTASAADGSEKTRTVADITWQRPVPGSVLSKFSTANKGITFNGSLGQVVSAAADGRVVYVGSGLRGYGNLVIVQHTPVYLTAYGHNQNLLVSLGQSVKRGQAIASMGNSDTDRVKLLFELRQSGKPVNPADYIPL